MFKDSEGFFLQDDLVLNQHEAWSAQEFPQAKYHFFRDSGCVITSLWNMCVHFEVTNFLDRFPTPWELNEACKVAGAFYPNANIEMGLLHKVMSVEYVDRFTYDEAALKEELAQDDAMCLLRVNGQNSPYHYVLPLPANNGELWCFDPKMGYVALDDFKMIYQIILFRKIL